MPEEASRPRMRRQIRLAGGRERVLLATPTSRTPPADYQVFNGRVASRLVRCVALGTVPFT